ncbi:MAG TPA: SDR family NAD(P)-dependent oxidoreductase, partial [Labilithrix sp.]
MDDLEGRVAVVTGGGDERGREIALRLASHGCRVVVTGPDERALAETVGEIAYGGGKARHVVGALEAALARAVEVFGQLDVIVHAGAGATLEAAPPYVVFCDARTTDDSAERIVMNIASAVRDRQ